LPDTGTGHLAQRYPPVINTQRRCSGKNKETDKLLKEFKMYRLKFICLVLALVAISSVVNSIHL
jgi:hypothetical protein